MPKVQQNGGGGSGRGRRGRGAHIATSLAEINVVPLVDVMLVLLIIFMVTAPMMQQGFEVNLPQTRKANAVNAEPVYVTVPADFSRTRVVMLDKREVRIDILHELVRQALLTRDDKSVFIRADAAATVQDFMTVTDKLKEGGVEKVGIVSQPESRR
ncbi:MAG TPA: biopolymer transporter ExbD [Vicinamibacterales bacterium]|jgi:biopolymer transport protein TolR